MHGRQTAYTLNRNMAYSADMYVETLPQTLSIYLHKTDPAYEQCLEADGVPGIMFTVKILSMLLKYNSEKAKTTIGINQ